MNQPNPVEESAATDPWIEPPPDVTKIRHLLHAELSWKSRLPYVLVLLLAAGVMAGVGSLLLTEPELPAATRTAFAAICIGGALWVAFCAWVLTRRKVLYAKQEIVSARLGMIFSGLFVLGALASAFNMTSPRGGLAAAVFGLAMFALAAVLHSRARRHHAALLELRKTLSEHPATTELAA